MSSPLDFHKHQAETMPLADIRVGDPKLFQQNVVWPYFERLRREAPVHYSVDSPYGPYWSITGYDEISEVNVNHKDFSSSSEMGGITIADITEDLPLEMFISMDPPKHTVQRRTVQPSMNSMSMKNYEKLIRERTINVLDNLPVGEPFDWVSHVSIELTIMMLATLFGFPIEDRAKLTRWSDVTTGKENRDICESVDHWRAELMECFQYFSKLREDAVLAEPKPELISMLAHGEATHDMPPMEYLGNILLLIVGGNDTTRNSMTGSILAMNRWPEEYQKLRDDPSLIPNFTSEIIRWQTPLAHMRRTALRDVEVGGKTIKKGEKVIMWYAAGNRDESTFPDPDKVFVDRKNARRHLSFGVGIHRCVGAKLGEMQLNILWEELLKRHPVVEVLEEPSHVLSSFVNGYSKLMVRIPSK